MPEFYHRDDKGIPRAWVARMRNSMATLTPRFSTNRTVREYTERCYLPAAEACRERSARHGELGADIAKWRSRLNAHWSSVRFGRMRIESRDGQHLFEAEIHLGALKPADVHVELYAQSGGGEKSARHPMQRAAARAGMDGCYRYRAAVPTARRADAFTARIFPHHPAVSVPLEAPQILWQR